MEVQRYRLGEVAPGAPYYANLANIPVIPRHRRLDYYDMVLIMAGDGHHVSFGPSGEKRVRRLMPGHLVLYRPVDELAIVPKQPHGLSIRQIAFPVSDWETFSTFAGVDAAWISADEPPMVETGDHMDSVARAFEVVIERFWDSPTLFDLVQFWIDVIPMFFPAHPRRPIAAGTPGWFLESLGAMREEANLRGGIARWVELARVSPSHLSATSRRYLGKTPTLVVTDLRIRHAAILLSTTGESIGSIAQRCGFGTFAYFSSAFRRKHHLAPREFRARAAGRYVGR